MSNKLNKNEIAELKEPCPWCGSKDIRLYKNVFDDITVECNVCFTHVTFGGKVKKRMDAIKAWNTRKQSGAEFDKNVEKYGFISRYENAWLRCITGNLEGFTKGKVYKAVAVNKFKISGKTVYDNFVINNDDGVQMPLDEVLSSETFKREIAEVTI